MDALRLSQMALRAFAAVYGTLGILCVCASFVARRCTRSSTSAPQRQSLSLWKMAIDYDCVRSVTDRPSFHGG